MAYLDNLPEDALRTARALFSYDIPCIIIARKMKCPPELLRQARKTACPCTDRTRRRASFRRRPSPI
ncbi:MAG: hypothetical protein ACLUI3_09065 [Christensenellales bacterium]